MTGLVGKRMMAQQVRSMGRRGDTELIHVNKDEKAALDSMTPYGQATINPDTGLPEYFSLKKVFKGAKKAVKGVVKGAKGVVKGALSGDIASIAGLAAAVYTGGAALGAWGAGTVAAGGAGSAFAAGGQGFWSTVGSNLSNMATTTFSSLSGGASAVGPSGVQAFGVQPPATLNTGSSISGSIGSGLGKVGSLIANNKEAFLIAGNAAGAMLSANAEQQTADNNLEIAKNRARWDNEAMAENYADSGYFQQTLGFKAPDYARTLTRPTNRGLVARRMSEGVQA